MKRRMIAMFIIMALVLNIDLTMSTTSYGESKVKAADTGAACIVKEVSLDGAHSTAVTGNGDLYCWGRNFSESADNKAIKQTEPLKILGNVSSYISTNPNWDSSSKDTDVVIQNAAITENGDLYCWGQNTYGGAGNGIANQKTPTKVLSNVTSVSLGSDFIGYTYCAAITENGDLYCWGHNECGNIGNGTTTNQIAPVKILENISSVFLSDATNPHTMAISTNGDLYCWGSNDSGQIGNGTTIDQTTPVKVLENVTSVSSGAWYNAAITENGDLYCWGENWGGNVGNGSEYANQTTPIKVLSNVASVSVSGLYSAAITENGDLYCWGENDNGQIGNGTTINQTTPVKVLKNVYSVSLKAGTSTAITENGDLYCWGRNNWGQVGNGTTTDQTTPVKVLENVSSVLLERVGSLGCYSTAITKNGDLYHWGRNAEGQAGNGTTTNQLTPTQILENVRSVSLSESHCAAVTTNGDLYCWGNNKYGQVGNGTTTNQLTPVKIFESNASDNIEPPISSTQPSDNTGATAIDNSEITIRVNDYDTLFDGGVEGANAEIEGIGTATTDSRGIAHITNSLTDPSAMKRICVTKDGYRDYIFYTTIVSPEMVGLFSTNQLYACLKKKKAGDETNPYVSTVMYYRDGVAKTCGGQHFQKSDTVTFRACGVWNDKEPGYYCMYRDGVGGKSLESEDGIFKCKIGDAFTGRGDIYVKMIAKDGTESEPEQVYITVPEGDSNLSDDSYIPILNESAESGWQVDVPFLNDDKLSFDLGKIKTTIKRDGSKVRIMLGAETPADSGNIFDDKAWEDWKKFCESQPKDLSLSQWKEVLSSENLDTHWTSKAKIKATGYGWLENDLSADSTTPLTGGIQVVIDMSTTFKQQYAVGVIPVYLEESIGVKGELGGSVTFDTKEKKFGGKTNAKITPSLSVGGGVGVLYVATVGAEGSASMPMQIEFPKGLTQADLEGSLNLKASVLGFNYSKEMVKATYPLYPSKSSAKSTKKWMKQGSNDFTGNCHQKHYTIWTIIPCRKKQNPLPNGMVILRKRRRRNNLPL